MQTNGGKALMKSLEAAGVDIMFGLPGGAILPAYDPLIDSPMRHVLVRHEQGAGHMAEGYAHATGKPGVAMVTSGPAATNMVTPLADAMLDSVPLVCITGQVASGAIGTDAFQECDTTGITMAVTKHNFLVTEAAEIPQTIHDAFHIATTGRPGPVLVDLPKDLVDPNNPASVFEDYEPTGHNLPGYRPQVEPEVELVRAAAELILASTRPVIYSGGGILKARAAEALRELAELLDIPVVTTLMNRGGFPDDHDLALGMPGMHGNYTAVTALQESDLLIALGARFDDRVTGRLDEFSPNSKKIHVDIDASSINKNVMVDLPIVGDAGAVLEDMLALWQQRKLSVDQKSIAAWWDQINEWRAKDCLRYEASSESIKPQHAIQRLYELTKDRDVYVTTEVGQHQLWAAQFMKFEEPNRWMTSGGLGTMGYGLPSAVGVQLAHPESLVIDIAGEASVLMTMQEMSTAAQYELPIKIFILNNEYMGMVRQWQELLHGGRYSHSYTEALPDFVKLAEAYKGVGIRAETPGELDDAIKEMIEVDKPVLFDCRVTKEANCFPMIPSGKGHHEMLLGDEPTNLDEAITDEGKVLV